MTDEDRAFNETQLALALPAVDLVEADVQRSTGSEMRFDVAIRPIEPGDDFELLIVSLHGNYQTPVMMSTQNPESTAELADNMQDHIVEELHSAWPVCPVHGRGLYAQVVGEDAVWYCRGGDHSVSKIGEFGLA